MLGTIGSLLAQRAAPSGGSGVTPLLLLVLMGAFFYFLLIRPQQRRTRQQRSLIQSLEVGDEVMTIGGIFGIIQQIDDDRVTLEVAPGVNLEFVRSAIARRVEAIEDEAYDEDDEGRAEDEEEEREAGSPS
ncbi:MAG TPA: preprotein translocase subunit YajC [Actinomycetota bacterium]